MWTVWHFTTSKPERHKKKILKYGVVYWLRILAHALDVHFMRLLRRAKPTHSKTRLNRKRVAHSAQRLVSIGALRLKIILYIKDFEFESSIERNG